MNGWRAVQASGFVLAAIMLLLGFAGTTSSVLFYTYCVLAMVGSGMFLGGRAMDERGRG